MQIQADVLGIPVHRNELEEATALGAAILACTGVKVYKSVEEAAENMIRSKDVLSPNPENVEVYSNGFEKYKKLYSALAGSNWER